MDLPPPVGIRARVSCPASTASMISSCKGLKWLCCQYFCNIFKDTFSFGATNRSRIYDLYFDLVPTVARISDDMAQFIAIVVVCRSELPLDKAPMANQGQNLKKRGMEYAVKTIFKTQLVNSKNQCTLAPHNVFELKRPFGTFSNNSVLAFQQLFMGF